VAAYQEALKLDPANDTVRKSMQGCLVMQREQQQQ
jgi:hypothetical protein